MLFRSACVLASLLLVAVSRARQPEPSPQPPHRPDPLIQQIVADISEQRIAETMRRLESFETRNTLSDATQTNRGIGAARQWIFEQFKSSSPRLQVSFDTCQIQKTNRIYKDIELRNVVALLPGTMPQASNRWILVSGHYDSLNLKDAAGLASQPAKAAELFAPGVSDDASGTACALECARVLSQHEFDATLVFVAFAGEEQGLVGAHALARRLKTQKQEIQAVLNNDIIGNEVSGNGASDNRHVLLFSEDPNDSPSRQIARFVHSVAERYSPDMGVRMIFRQDRFGRGGDQEAFNDEGYAGVRFTTASENFANQHSATDTFTNASPSYTARVTRINAAAAAALALAPRSPATQLRLAPAGAGRRDNRIASGSEADAPVGSTNGSARAARGRPGLGRSLSATSGYDAVLRWDQPDPEPDLAGFIVVLRSTTAPDWEREIWAGNVREFVLKDTPIDQFVLGVKAVDRDGHESPASAYVPAPRRAPNSTARDQ
jgi:hypothetical protein